MTSRRVVWRRSGELDGVEHCTLTLGRSGRLSLVGCVLGVDEGVPVRVDYVVETDSSGVTTSVLVEYLRGFEQRSLHLARDAPGAWTVDGAAAGWLHGCTDVDLGCSPATNALPIHRLRLDVGSSRDIRAAWVRFPELSVTGAAQTYLRLGEFAYRYSSGAFASELSVDEAGLVVSYDEWQRTGTALSADGDSTAV